MSENAELRADVAVIGGGVIGLATAYELARLDRRVLLVERGALGGGASRAAAGMLAPAAEAEIEPPEVVALGRESLARYPAFVEGIERLAGQRCGLRSEGTLWVAVDPDSRAELEELRARLGARGVALRALSGEEVRRREPRLTGRVLAGLDLPGDGQIDPRRLCLGLSRAAERLGCRFLVGATARRIECVGGRACAVRGDLAAGGGFHVEAPQVVVAAGAWSARTLDWPLEPVGLRPVKGQLVRLRGAPLIKCVVRAPGVYLVPREDGELLVGGTMEEQGYDERPTAGAVLDLLRRAFELLPGIYELELAEVSVGLRSAVDDQRPVIGESAVAGLYLAVGHFRNGVLLAPATAHHLARAVVLGSSPPELAPFAPARLVRHNEA